MDGFSNLFAAPPSYLPGLLGEEETERLRREAQQSGLMNLGLSLLAGAGPSPQRQGLGQLLAQGVMAGQQASRNAYEQAVRDRMMQEQIAEQRRVRAEQAETLRQQQVAQQMAQGLFVSPSAQLAQGLQRTGAEVTAAMPEASAMDVRMMRQPVPAAQTTGIDMDTLRNILINAPRAAAPYMQTVEQLQKLTPRPKLTEFDPLKELRDEDGRIVRPAGQKQDKETTDIRNYQQAVEQGYKGSFLDYQQLTGPKTQTTINMPSEGERKAAVLSSRLNFSVGEMNRAIGKDPNAAAPNTIAEAAKFLTRSDFISNKLTPTQRQIVEAAQLDVLDAALTLGTGAAYTVQQLESYRKAYFPQLNEDKATIESKQRRLENLLKTAELAAGRAAPSIKSTMPQPISTDTEPEKKRLPAGVSVTKVGG